MKRDAKTARWVLAGMIAIVGGLLLVLMIFTGRINADSALLFVGLPLGLAVALAVAPIKSTHGRVFQLTTIFLLLAAVAAHEGAICVILAAPLVYGVAHGMALLIQQVVKSSRRYVLAVPLLMLSALEGVDSDMRINPEQAVEIVRVVRLTPAEVTGRVEVGPRPTPIRSLPLRLLRMPPPESVSGVSLRPGAQWTFAYHGSSHGPGGHAIFEVTAREAGSVTFRVVEDTSITARWFEWRTATLSWHAADDGGTEIRLSIVYERGLDPSWYFGPVNDMLLHEGGAHVLDMLALR